MMLILDASAIIAFYSEMCEPQLLHELANYDYRLVAPKAVINEIRKGHRDTRTILEKALEDRKISICGKFKPSEISAFKRRFPSLGAGEIQVLILGAKMKKRKSEYLCILDEGPARKVATRYHIAKKGTIGLLDVLSNLGIIDEKKREKLLKVLKHSEFRIRIIP